MMSLVGDDIFEHISSSLNLLDTWVENEKFLGWDPHDALNSPLLKKYFLIIDFWASFGFNCSSAHP